MIQQDPILEAMNGPEPAPYQAPTRLERIMGSVQRDYTPGQTRLQRVMGGIKPRASEYAAEAAGSFAGNALEAIAGGIEAPSVLRRKILNEQTDTVRTADVTLGEAAGEWLRRKAAGMRNEIVEQSQPKDALHKAAKFATRDVAGAGGSTVGMAGAGLVAAGAGIPPWVGVALSGAATNGAAAAYEARAAGATPDQEWTAFALNGLMGTSEALPIAGQLGRILGRADAMSGGWVRHALIEGGEEIAQESTQQLVGNWVARSVAGYDQDRQLLDGLAESGGAAGFSGVIASALASLAGGKIHGGPKGPAAMEPTGTPAQPSGVDLTGQSGTFAEQTTGAAPLPVLPPSGDAGAAASDVLSELSAANQRDVREVSAPDTPEATYVREFASQRGLKVRFVEGADAVHGASEPGTIYVDTKAPLRSVAYHETVHQLGDEAGRLADDLRALDPEGATRYEQAYAENYQRATGRALDAALASEEGVALRAEMNSGMLYEALQRPERLRAILESKPGAWTRIVDAIVRAFQKVGLGVRTSKQRALDALRAEVAGQDASRALDSETAIRVALRIRDAFDTLQPRVTEASEGMATVENSDALAGSDTPGTAPETREPERGPTEQARATSPAITVAEMPKGRQIGTDLTGQPIYEKEERGPVQRPGTGIPQPKVAQPGIFDEVGGLFEKQAYGTEDLTPPPTPSRKELLANKAVRAEFEALADEAGTEGVGGQIIRGESDNLGSGRGPVIGRTRKIAKAEWWGRRPGDTSPAHVKRAIRKALQGATLTDQEAETVDFLLYEAATRVDPDTYNANTTEAQKERAAIQNPGRNRKVPGVPFSVAYHGSPYDFDEFRSDKIGTGEGAQAFGHGLYFTDKREIAEHYRDKLAKGIRFESLSKDENDAIPDWVRSRIHNSNDPDTAVAAFEQEFKDRVVQAEDRANDPDNPQPWLDRANIDGLKKIVELLGKLYGKTSNRRTGGRTYEVDLAPAEDEYLLWDKPLSEQSEKVRRALDPILRKYYPKAYGQERFGTQLTGQGIYEHIAPGPLRESAAAKAASDELRAAGIRGIKYLAGDGSRAKQEGTYNYVIFDPADVKVRAKFSVAPRTDSPEFKRWFGESKVVDEVGNPLVVYHGTNADFTKFNPAAGRKRTGPGKVWFTSNPDVADVYATGSQDGPDGARILPVYVSLENPYVFHNWDEYTKTNDSDLITAGHDGVITPWIHGTAGYVFSAEQVKSATGNRGTFDPKNPDIRFSVAPKGSFDLPDDTRSSQFNRALLDSFEALRLTPELDSAISRRPGLAYGRAERVQAQTIRGMIDVAKKVGKEQAYKFLYALHAPTRNKIIAERSGGKMGEESQPGSGMTTSDARKIAAEGLKNPDLMRLRDMNRRLNRERLDALEQAGLLSKEQRAEWEKFGPDYVPLRTADDPGSRVSGGSLNVVGPESKRAEGRSTIADSPLSFGVSSFAQAVERAERNKVGQLVAEFVEQNPGDQWGVYKSKDAIPEGWEVLSLKRDGEPVYIGTSNQAIASAFKQMDVAKATGVLKVAGVFRRYMHNVIIKYNPPFALSNAFRDMGTAAAKVTITDKAATGARVLKNAPAAMLGSWKAIREEGKGGEWGKWYREARDAGALVGWNELGSFQDVEDAISRSKRGAILNAIEQANRGVELGTRVALYEAMRAQGKTQEEAALISRDGTTDFARRGNYSSQLSSLYLFANANLQGTASLWRAVAAHPARGTAVLGALVAMGYLASLASRQLGDGWDDIPDYQKRRMGGVMAGGTLYGVPLPYGFDVFYYLGARAEAAANGRAQEDSLGMDVLEAAIQSFSPVQGADLLQTVTPTIGRPLVEIVTNKDFAGNPIRPQQSPFDRTPSPRSEQTFASVDPTLKAVTQGLNRATGGDSVRPGAIDVSAEDVEHVLKFLGGGLGSNAQRIITAANKWTSGEPVRKSDIPFLRTFMSEVPESAVANLYYDNLAAIEREVEARKKGEEVLDARALALATYARNVDGRVKKLRERMKASPELRPTLEPAMRAAMASLNERLAR